MNPLKSDKTLSILIDERGDFGKYDFKDPNYHVVMVIHEQQDGIMALEEDQFILIDDPLPDIA